jgi:hypothetical protein
MSVIARVPLRIQPPPKLSSDFREAEAQRAKPGQRTQNLWGTVPLILLAWLVRWDVVRPERFELPTCCSGGNRSIQLSYGRARISTVYMGGGKGFNGGLSE